MSLLSSIFVQNMTWLHMSWTIYSGVQKSKTTLKIWNWKLENQNFLTLENFHNLSLSKFVILTMYNPDYKKDGTQSEMQIKTLQAEKKTFSSSFIPLVVQMTPRFWANFWHQCQLEFNIQVTEVCFTKCKKLVGISYLACHRHWGISASQIRTWCSYKVHMCGLGWPFVSQIWPVAEYGNYRAVLNWKKKV